MKGVTSSETVESLKNTNLQPDTINIMRKQEEPKLMFRSTKKILLFVLVCGCSADEDVRSGSFTLLTYNVAGLPQGISSSNPETNIPQISPLLNAYDIVLAQEDFWYHEELSSQADHVYQSNPWNGVPEISDIGDGLNRFSIFPFGELTRMSWPDCYGTMDCASDCLANKGFSVATHEIDVGILIDIYNLHMEAGGCPQDAVIRADSIQLLLDRFAESSTERAIIVAGDYNLHEEDDLELAQLMRLFDEGGFGDVCWSLDCGKTNIDRIFFRSSSGLRFAAESWRIPHEFVDAEGEDLSDHEPVAVTLVWIEE